MNVTPITLVVAEDHELARCGLVMTLEEREGFCVVAEAENGEAAVRLTEKHHPAAVLMDIGMPKMNGIEATRQIKQRLPEVKVVMLTSHDNEEEVLAALSAGADAYCIKDIKIERLCQVLEMVMEGALWLDPAVARVVMTALPGDGISEPGNEVTEKSPQHRKRYNTHLTERELEVLSLVVAGKSNKEIAKLLNVTTHTAKTHVSNIIQKLSVDDRTQVAVKALQEGLVSAQER